MTLTKEFFDFIIERQRIWYKRFVLKEKSPWTSDKILQNYKIINVYRELDRCTLYILKKMGEVKDRKKLLLNIIFYRFFNQDNFYETLEIEPFGNLPREDIIRSIEKIRESGGRIFNNAYLISSGTKGQKKYLSVLDSIWSIDLDKLTLDLDNAKTPRESLEILQEIPMVGPFLACEIWTDLTYFNFFKQGWADNDFVNIGPGAAWGLDIVFGEKLSKKEMEEKLRELYDLQKEFLDNDEWKKIAYKDAFSNYPFLSITNIEGSLCEFRKYWRLRKGYGKKRYFNPTISQLFCLDF